jgi:hypothetical protein
MDSSFPSSSSLAPGLVNRPAVRDDDRARRRILTRLGRYEGPLSPIWAVLIRDASPATLLELEKLLRRPARL